MWTLFYLLSISSLLGIFAVVVAIHVTVPDVVAVAGEDTVIRCYIKFHTQAEISQETIVFTALDTKQECRIVAWEMCPSVCLENDVRPAHFSCGCLKRSIRNKFQFYLYLRVCPAEIDRSHYSCAIESRDSIFSIGQLRLIDFSTKPKSDVYRCEGEKINFRWTFNPNHCYRAFVIRSVTWKFYPLDGGPVTIGTLDENMTYTSNSSYFGDRAMMYSVALKKTIPRLMVTSLTPTDQGTFEIEVTFFSQEHFIRRMKSKRKWSIKAKPDYEKAPAADNDNTSLSVIYDDGTSNTPEEHAAPNVIEKTFSSNFDDCSGSFGSEEDKNASEGDIVPLGRYFHVREPVLRGRAMVYIMEHPPDLQLVFKVLEKYGGEISLYCTALSYSQNMSFEHINFVIKHFDRVIATSVNSSSVVLKIPIDSSMTNYSCELAGDTFRCGYEKSLKSVEPIYISDLLIGRAAIALTDVTLTAMDIFIILEGVVCIFLMLWNCKLFIFHAAVLSVRSIEKHTDTLNTAVESIEEERARRLSLYQSTRDQTSGDQSSRDLTSGDQSTGDRSKISSTEEETTTAFTTTEAEESSTSVTVTTESDD